MTKVNRGVWVLAVSVVVWLAAAQFASAGRYGRYRARRTRPVSRQPARTMPANPYNAHHRFPDNDWFYPRYTGAFHARYFNEMRYPTGDRGLRGTAW